MTSLDAPPSGVRVLTAGDDTVLSPPALALVATLQRELQPARAELLARRVARQADLDAGVKPDFLPDTREVREGSWQVAPAPPALQDRRVEITGPVERKMMINALNSGAKVFMADFEDANSPTWENVIKGQLNLADAVRGTIELETPQKRYTLNDEVATLMVRPRGWHLSERHVEVDGQPVSAGLFDFGLAVFHNGQESLDRGSGPFFYLPKLESHLEARLWRQAFELAEREVGLPHGSIRATVLIETILAAYEMEEILWELRDYSAGLNAGRWDYIFSAIKRFRNQAAEPLPDRVQVTMTVPFMRAYTELLVRTCHRRGAHAIGGMAAFIPSRRDPEVNATALARVREDKVREANDGFDGTWVAHPDLVPVAREVFDGVLGERPNQIDRQRDDVTVDGSRLVDFAVPGGTVTEGGLRLNVGVGIEYLASWLRGNGAAAINNLMEDAATAEISRSQVWQWVRRGRFTPEHVQEVMGEELERIRAGVGEDGFAAGRYQEAAELFRQVALAEEFVEFLTLPAYERLD